MHALHIKNSCERKTDRKRKERDFGYSVGVVGVESKINAMDSLKSSVKLLVSMHAWKTYISTALWSEKQVQKSFLPFPLIFFFNVEKREKSEREGKKCFANANPKSSI